MDNGNKPEMFNSELKNKLKSIVIDELNTLSEDLAGVADKLEKVDNELVYKEAGLLKEYSALFGNNDRALDSQSSVFGQIMTLGALEAEINIFSESLNMMQALSIQSSLIPIVKGILNKIKFLSRRLWQLLSQVLNLKEWSIAGDANINVLGLSGGVTVQLKFEP